MKEENVIGLSTPPEASSGIRELFDAYLSAEGIDCFSVYSEDRWQRGVLVPQEIDTHLFYPELTYAASSDWLFPEDAKESLKRGAIPLSEEDARNLRLQGGFFVDAHNGPATRAPSILRELDGELGPLVRDFLHREEIRSSAVFFRGRPAENTPPKTAESSALLIPTLPDILFFNFRNSKEKEFASSEVRTRLARLASLILDYVPVLATSHNQRAKPAAIRSVRAFSALIQTVQQRLQSRPKRGGEQEFFNDLSCSLWKALLGPAAPHPSSPEQQHGGLIVSIYLAELNESGGSLLCAKGTSPRANPYPGDQKLSGGPASLTILTTLTGCSHVLQRVDRFKVRSDFQSDQPLALPGQKFNQTEQTSIPLTNEQARVLKEFDDETSVEGARSGSTSEISATITVPAYRIALVDAGADVSPGASRHHLVVHHPPRLPQPSLRTVTDPQAVDLIRKLRSAAFGKRWSGLVDKIERRMLCQHAHIYGRLDQQWEQPSSEVCVPIRVAGQCIGCINIESAQPNRFNPTYIGILSSFASIVGMEVARQRERQLDEDARLVIERIHTKSELIGEIGSGGKREKVVSHLERDTFKTGLYARRLAGNCGADRGYFVCEPNHDDAPMRFVGVSHPEWHSRQKSVDSAAIGWLLPRPNGWTYHLLNRAAGTPARPQPGAVVGVMVRLKKGDLPERAWWIGRSGANAATLFDPDPTETLPTFDGHTSLEDHDLVLGLIVPDLMGGARTQADRRRVVLWLVYKHSPIVLPVFVPSTAAKAQESRRTQFLDHVVETASHAAGVVDHWQSTLLSRYEITQDKAHSAPNQTVLQKLSTLIGTSSHPNAERSLAAAVRELLWIEQERQLADAIDPRRMREHRRFIKRLTFDIDASQFDQIPVNTNRNSARYEIVNLTHLGCDVAGRHAPYCRIGAGNSFPNDRFVFRRGGYAAIYTFIVAQSVRNAVAAHIDETWKAPANSQGAPVSISLASHPPDISTGGVRFRIDNVLGRFPDSMLPAEAAYRRRLPLLMAGKEGRGFDMMLRAARILNPEAPPLQSLRWGNSESNGAYLEFDVDGRAFEKIAAVSGAGTSPD